jgi:hypothetical protein
MPSHRLIANDLTDCERRFTIGPAIQYYASGKSFQRRNWEHEQLALDALRTERDLVANKTIEGLDLNRSVLVRKGFFLTFDAGRRLDMIVRLGS